MPKTSAAQSSMDADDSPAPSLQPSCVNEGAKDDQEKPKTKSKKGKSKKDKKVKSKGAAGADGESGGENETTLLSASQSAEERERRLHLGDVEIQKLCEANGLSEEDFVRKSPEVQKLELFQVEGIHTLRSFRLFTGLRELHIICQGHMTRISGLEGCPQLQALWIQQCKIQRIEGLQSCKQLHTLHLTTNHISRIEGLEELTELQVLWLNENRISSLHGLSKNVKLRSLWIAKNKIEKIGTALDSLTNLQELNLANNLIGSFKEILNLNRLPGLRNVCFSDPHFGDSPVCNLCNYQTYILYHLSQLSSLDTMLVGDDSKSLAEATYMKKKMYYNMRIKTLKRNTTNVIRKAQESKQVRTSHINLNLNVLLRQTKDIQRKIESQKWLGGAAWPAQTAASESIERGDEDEEKALTEDELDQFRQKYQALHKGIDEKQREILETKQQFEAFRRRSCEISEENIARLIVELETGGNIRLEDGRPRDVWFSSCIDLVRSRFYASDYKTYGVSDIRVHRVTRIHNRFLRNRFEKRMEEVVTAMESSSKIAAAGKSGKGSTSSTADDKSRPKSKRPLEYLFFGSDPKASASWDGRELLEIAGEGFRIGGAGSVGGAGVEGIGSSAGTRGSGCNGTSGGDRKGEDERSPFVRLTNSFSQADLPRTRHYVNHIGRKLQGSGKRITGDFKRANSSSWSGSSAGEDESSSIRIAEELELQNLRKVRLPNKDGNEGMEESTKSVLRSCRKGFLSVPEGRLLIAKVFLGNCATESDSASRSSSKNKQIRPEDYSGYDSVSRAHHSDLKHREWFVFDNALVLPEYIVEYELVTKAHLQAESHGLQLPRGVVAKGLNGQPMTDQEASDMGPLLRPLMRFMAYCSNMQSGFAHAALKDGVAAMLQIHPSVSPTLNVGLHDDGAFMTRSSSAMGGLELQHDSIFATKEGGISAEDTGAFPRSAFHLVKKTFSECDGAKLELLSAVIAALSGVGIYNIMSNAALQCAFAASLGTFDDTLLAHGRDGRGAMFAASAGSGAESKEALSSPSSSSTALAATSSQQQRPDACTRALNMPPHLPARPKLFRIGIDAIQKQSRTPNHSNIVYLNFHGSNIRKIENLESCSNLRVLVLSFNEVHKIEGLGTLANLERLELGFNLIKRIEGLRGLQSLKMLELNNNLIYRLEDVNVLKKYVPSLTSLNLRNNAMCEAKTYRAAVLRRLQRLQHLDGVAVTAFDRSAAAENTQVTITKSMIRAHAKCGADSNHAISLAARNRLSPPRETRGLHERFFHRGPSSSKIKRETKEAEDGAAPSSAETDEEKEDGDSSGGGGDDDDDDDWGDGGSSGKEGKTNNDLDDSDSFWPSVEQLDLSHRRIRKIENLHLIKNLRRANFTDNEISRIEGMEGCTLLEELCLEENRLLKLEGLSTCIFLKKLDLGKNKLCKIEGLSSLVHLSQLSLEDNDITSLAGLEKLSNLMELYICSNRIGDLKEVQHIKDLPKLIIVDLSGNPICKSSSYRIYCVYYMRKLKVLDGIGVDAAEQQMAREKYSGKLTSEFLTEKIGHKYFEHIRELDLSGCRIKEIENLCGDEFSNLRELNLDNNLLTSLRGLSKLSKLNVLRLNHNRLRELVCSCPGGAQHGKVSAGGTDELSFQDDVTLDGLRNLEVLQLGYNNIVDIRDLKLGRLKQLKVLFLQGNEISRVEGLSGCTELRELVLDKNRIRYLEPDSLEGLTNLRELRIEENNLRSLTNFNDMNNLQSLYLGFNRIAEIAELDNLASIPFLLELTLSNNPMARNQLYRPSAIRKLPTLRFIDGREILHEERERVEMLFVSEQRPPPGAIYFQDPVRAAVQTGRVPVKLTSVNFETLTGFHRGHGGFSSPRSNTQESLQGGGGTTNGLIMGGRGYNFDEHSFGSSLDRVGGGGASGGGDYGVLGNTNMRSGEYKMYMPTGGGGSDSRRSSVDSSHSGGVGEAQFVQRRSLIPSNAVPSSGYGQQAGGILQKGSYKPTVPYGYGGGQQDQNHAASQRSPGISGRMFQHPTAPSQGQFSSRSSTGSNSGQVSGSSARSSRQKVMRSRSKSGSGRRPSRPRF